MIVSYPIVNSDGAENGCKVSFRLGSLYAIETMSKWVREDIDDIESVERYMPIPGCITVYVQRGEFNIKADYADLELKMKELNEWCES
jgi:hypothetical protein